MFDHARRHIAPYIKQNNQTRAQGVGSKIF